MNFTSDCADLSFDAFIGGVYLNARRMIIIPLIVTSIIVAMIGGGKHNGFRLMAGKTWLFFTSSRLIKSLVGLFTIVSLPSF